MDIFLLKNEFVVYLKFTFNLVACILSGTVRSRVPTTWNHVIPLGASWPPV